MNYFISDLHLGHVNCLAFDNRPFVDIEKHDKAIIDNWNSVVGANDDVYVLGDVSWHNATKTIEILKQLNGHIHLIKGNHDRQLLKNREVRNLFVEITDYKELDIGDGKICALFHYPIPCFNKHFYGSYHLYGHVHTSFEWNMVETFKRQMTELYTKPCYMYNVGCMVPYMNYTPRTLEEILSFAVKGEKINVQND